MQTVSVAARPSGVRLRHGRKHLTCTHSLKTGGSSTREPKDDTEEHKVQQTRPNDVNGTGFYPKRSSPFVNGPEPKAEPTEPSLTQSDLNWNDIDNNSKSTFLKEAFEADFLRKSSVYRDPSQDNSPERLTDFLKEPDTRQRFVKRCLIPTAVAFALGCLAYVMQVCPRSDAQLLVQLSSAFRDCQYSAITWWLVCFLADIRVFDGSSSLPRGLLGFLMAFVTSTNYNRWLQARASLCNITILCTDIASRADVFLTNKDEDGIRARREMARFLRLLYTTLILTITDGSLWGGTSEDHANVETTSKELRRMMMEDASPSERRILLGGGPRDLPFLVIDLMRVHINKDTTLKSFVHNTFGSQFIAINCQDSLRNKVDELFPTIGNCLALALTPLPLGYRTIFSTLLSVLVYTFPFALVSEITWETPIVSAFLAFGYYGVYSMSQELIFPFRPRASTQDKFNLGLFSCNAEWVRVMNKEFNRILIKPT